ncbi:MAG: DNA gyrase subunit A [Clostridia bacterium]|nr:DNA gyrase subunit A [Clostridia bacterium]
MSEEITVNGSMIPVEIVDEMQKAYLAYSMSVIVGRALPDVRVGLKPVHRRILYTMYENSLYPDKPYRKCADTVGSVLGRYHPHGDTSVYDAMVRMAQDFSLRYMMVDGHGNFGSIDGYPAAAYRYTESRLSKLAMEMLRDIDKDTVEFTTNYDDRLKEPTVLPSRIPSLLVNGSQGIAVGMATNIPPHNLGEVIDGMCHLIDHPDCGLDELCQHIKGPDFPTGGVIMGLSGIRAAYATGKGKIVVRGKSEIEEYRNGAYRITITEIPYMVNKQVLVKSIADLVKEKRVEGIDDVVDHSSRDGMRIVIELKKDVNPQVVLNQLYSYTQLQSTFGAIMLAIVDGQPKVLTLKDMLQHYIDYQCDVIVRRTRHDLKKAQERAHILEALKTALDYIDEVISIIRSSKTVQESKQRLMERFGFDEEQANAIVQMRLAQLTGLERSKIEDELGELHAKIEEYRRILADSSLVLGIVKDEALTVRDRFNDERRTEITAVGGEVDIEDLIPVEECVITMTNMGYVKRLPASEFSVQGRGGRGIKGMSRRDDDFANEMFSCSSHDMILFFSTRGRVYRLKAYEIPEASRTAKGLNIINLLPIQSDEKITAMIRIKEFDEESYLCMVTRKGLIKRIRLDEYNTARKGGIIALTLNEDDELGWVKLTTGHDSMIVATRKGQAIHFSEEDVRPMGRTAAGVRAIKLKNEGDEVIGMDVVTEDCDILTVTETGYGRRSKIDDYRLQTRGGSGTTNYRTEKLGDVASIQMVNDDDDIIMISQEGIVIRICAAQISCFNRPAKGVRVMRMGEGDKLVSFAKTAHEEPSDDETEEEGATTAPETAQVAPAADATVEAEQMDALLQAAQSEPQAE